MTVKLLKMTDDMDIIGEIVDQPNKHTDTIRLRRPMVVVTSDYDGYPLIALKMLNFYGTDTEISLPLSNILYTATPRSALAQFYTHTVSTYYQQFDMQIDSMLNRVYKQYLEETQMTSEDEQFLNILKRMASSSNTTIQ